MDLGEHFPCLNVADLTASIAFYEKLDFKVTSDNRQDNWAVLQHNNMVLCLFQGHIDENLINFRGGDVEEIAEVLSRRGVDLSVPAHMEADGSWAAEVRDPDGNSIFFNTFPDEREQYVGTGRLIDY